MTAKDLIEKICANNTHLLDEPEIKEIILRWQKDRDILYPTKNILGVDIKESDEFFKAITKDAGQRDQ